MMPVDRVMALLLFLVLGGGTCVCAGAPMHGDSVGAMTFLFTVWGSAYLVLRIWNTPGVAPRLRAQLIASALLCVAATIVTAWIYFHPTYSPRRTIVRPHPPSLYVATAVLGLSAGWFAVIKALVRRSSPPRGAPGAGAGKEEP